MKPISALRSIHGAKEKERQVVRILHKEGGGPCW